MTFGLAPKLLGNPSNVAAANDGFNDLWLTSYLAEIPWHIPALYMTPSEYALLQGGAHAIELSICVTYRGSTIQFETASTSSGLATLNQINDIAVANALNKTGWGSNVSFTQFGQASQSQSMLPLGIRQPFYGPVAGPPQQRGMATDYYGTDNPTAGFGTYVPHHQVGRHCFLYNYWAMSTRSTGTVTAPGSMYGGWPCMAEKIQQMDGKTVVNQCVLQSTYKPKMGMLKTPLRHVPMGLPYPNSGAGMSINTNGSLTNGRIATFSRDALDVGVPSDTQQGDRTSAIEGSAVLNNDNYGSSVNTLTYDIYTPIEKSQVSRTGYWGQADAHIQPSIHIGVQPVPSLAPADSLIDSSVTGQPDKWTDTRAYWEVTCTMTTKEYNPTHMPYAVSANVPEGDVILTYPNANLTPYITNPRAEGATFAGLNTNSIPILPL